MSILQVRRRATKGFTLVELLIVIIVIAILATITIVSYNGVQKRARDTRRMDDVNKIVDMLKLYAINNGTMYTASGCGYNGNGTGYFNYPYSGSTSMMQCLINAGVASTPIQDDSVSCAGPSCRTYMKYSCYLAGKLVTYVYANLETRPNNNTMTDGTCAAGIDDVYGMNYFVKFS